jgi:Vacuolar protein sorting-associated protein 26.
VDKCYESYYSKNLRVRYKLRLTIERNLSNNIIKEIEIFVVKFSEEPGLNCLVKLEAGYEDAVQIEFELSQLKYHNNDIVQGRVYFHIIRVRVMHMEIQVVRKETVGVTKNNSVFEEIIGVYEILDGPVAKGDTVPIRIFLKSCGVTPTYNNISNRASVKYFLKLFLKDEEGRSFSKTQEIVIWRPWTKICRDGIPSYKS